MGEPHDQPHDDKHGDDGLSTEVPEVTLRLEEIERKPTNFWKKTHKDLLIVSSVVKIKELLTLF
jgi:hypothetical protein